MNIDLTELCARLQIDPIPDNDNRGPLFITGLNTPTLAGANDLCFAETSDQAAAVAASAAGAVLVPEDFPPIDGPVMIRLPSPRNAFFSIAEVFVPASEVTGIHPSAVIAEDAELGAGVAVGACAVIAPGATIGERSIIGPGSYVGPNVTLGPDCVIEANVSLLRDSTLGARCVVHAGSTIGGDGFGFRWDGQGHRKVPQLGRVIIEDDCDIGCNCCVDRATIGVTRIRRGSKIDNLVQIAHNCELGEHVIMAGQSGIAGSSRIGNGTLVGGQVAISDHVQVGAGVRVGGQSGVTKDVPDGANVFGTPARAVKDTLRELAALAQLPRLIKQIKRQDQEIAALRERLEALEQSTGER
jgi:UDP-3-O-[3-hydroxymyristoyl] glucosamine N-acyltransferase